MTITTGASWLRGPRLSSRQVERNRAARVRKDASTGNLVDDKKRKLRVTALDIVKERLKARTK